MGKYYCMVYPPRVNRKVDHPFECVHSNVLGPYQLNQNLVSCILFSLLVIIQDLLGYI